MARARRLFRRLRTGFVLSALTIVGLVAAFALWRNPSIIVVEEAPVRFFQIATGPAGSTYFPIGKTLATVISRPPGSPPCVDGGRCGVPGLIAVSKASAGSAANVRGIQAGRIDSALAQADVAGWAYGGRRMFAREGPLDRLRVIAGLYPEAVHLVAAAGSGIDGIADLKGRRVAIGRRGTGTRANALRILRAFGLSPEALDIRDIEAAQAADLMLEDGLDAFFIIAGAPARVITDLMDRGAARLVPIAGGPVDDLIKRNKAFVRHTIHGGIYPGVRALDTISVPALWITSADAERQLILQITEALWNEGNRKLLDEGHEKARLIQLETALKGVTIPLHDGARLYYERRGMKLE